MAEHFKSRKEVDKEDVREELVSSLNDIPKKSPDGSI